MDEKIKAEHRLEEMGSTGLSYYWRCSCGAGDANCYSAEYARDEHAEHAQESGEYDVKTGFEVFELVHGDECQGCWKAAREAARLARRDRRYQVQASWVEPDADPWDTITSGKVHLARVRSPKIEEMK